MDQLICGLFGGEVGIRNGKMGREEQIEEREVLDSIFPDEITGEACSDSFLPPGTTQR